MCYCGAENQCFEINGNFSGCLRLFTWLAKPAADRKTTFFCCRGNLQVWNIITVCICANFLHKLEYLSRNTKWFNAGGIRSILVCAGGSSVCKTELAVNLVLRSLQKRECVLGLRAGVDSKYILHGWVITDTRQKKSELWRVQIGMEAPNSWNGLRLASGSCFLEEGPWSWTHTAENFMVNQPHPTHNKSGKWSSLFLLCREIHWSSERLKDLPKVIWPGGGSAGTSFFTQPCGGTRCGSSGWKVFWSFQILLVDRHISGRLMSAWTKAWSQRCRILQVQGQVCCHE